MEYLTTDKEGIKILIEVLKEKGIRQVVLSPGSRNAPLLVAFAREKQIRHFVVLDERSAAFMALGMAQQSGVPVALVCTSGTAPLNYAPAIAEAYYQRLPLIVPEYCKGFLSVTGRTVPCRRTLVCQSSGQRCFEYRFERPAGTCTSEYTLAGIALWAEGLPGAGS